MKVSGLNFFLAIFLLAGVVETKAQLFDEEDIIEITISGDTRVLLNDRGEDPQYHPITLSYTDNSEQVNLRLKAKTRGNFRRMKENCIYPPILLNFKKGDEATSQSLFKGQDEMKLVTSCQQEKFVVREYLAYKLYNLVTEKSFKARLIKLVFTDSIRNKSSKPLFGMLLEDEDKMAERNNLQISKELGLAPQRTQTEAFHTMAVFEYFIGNTDWSVQFRHNIKLIYEGEGDIPMTVPYDFDHAGIVSAPYAKPSEALLMSSVKERRYRGYCEQTYAAFEPVFAKFEMLKPEFKAIYKQNELLSPSYKKWVVKYIDRFYKTISDPRKRDIDFKYPCNPNGTGAVVIKGLGR